MDALDKNSIEYQAAIDANKKTLEEKYHANVLVEDDYHVPKSRSHSKDSSGPNRRSLSHSRSRDRSNASVSRSRSKVRMSNPYAQ